MLNNIGLPGILLIAVVVLVLFGRGKVSSLMGEVGKGITAFKRGVNDPANDADTTAEAERIAPRHVPGEAARDVTPGTTASGQPLTQAPLSQAPDNLAPGQTGSAPRPTDRS